MQHAVIMKDRSALLAAEPAEFQCADCSQIHYSITRTLPEDWARLDYRGRDGIRCSDCIEIIERNHGCSTRLTEAPEPLAVDSAGFAYVDGALCLLHGGCQIKYWPMPEVGAAVLHVQGGTAPGKDPAQGVLVTVDRGDLRQAIEQLSAIEAAIAPGASTGAA